MFRYIYLFLSFISFFYAINLALDLRHYSKLTGTTIAKEPHFHVENQDERYKLITHYKVGAKSFDATYEPHFLNEWAAEFEGKKWLANPRVYVDADDISYSALQKTFPIKQLAYTLILASLAGYFFILDRRLKNGGSTLKRQT